MTTPDDRQIDQIDAALASWRQGDCVLEGEHLFLHRTDDGPTEEPVLGFVVLTQTCDVVRKWKSGRRYIDVAPLVEVDAEALEKIRGRWIPQYAFIPGVADKSLVADLDRVMTVSKAVVATWPRTPGCSSDPESRALAQALARKITRFAFPDDFQLFVKKLRNRMQKKHNRASEEGDALQEMDDVRVRAAPSWDAEEIELFFWFVCGEKISPRLEANIGKFTDEWLAQVPPSGRFKDVDGRIATYEDMTAMDYLESDSLDFGYMSGPDDESA